MIASLIFFIVLLSQFRGGRSQAAQQVQQVIPPNTPPVIVVTTFYPSMTAEHRRMIIENRQEYAALHGKYTISLRAMHKELLTLQQDMRPFSQRQQTTPSTKQMSRKAGRRSRPFAMQ